MSIHFVPQTPRISPQPSRIFESPDPFSLAPSVPPTVSALSDKQKTQVAVAAQQLQADLEAQKVTSAFYELKRIISKSNMNRNYLERYYKELDISQQVFLNYIQAKTQEFIAQTTSCSKKDCFRTFVTRLFYLDQTKGQFLEMMGRISHYIEKDPKNLKRSFSNQEIKRYYQMIAIDKKTPLFQLSLMVLQGKLKTIFPECK